jgi:hypothetical protein
MFISFDNGAHWQKFDLNMPQVPINQIQVHKKDLIVATQGRGLWMIDNLSPLHQIAPTQQTGAITVYRPRDSYRTATGAAYLGPQIDYYLPTASSDTLRIEILDAQGKLVASYRSDAPQTQPRPGRGGGAGVDPDGSDTEMMEGRPGRGGSSGPPMNIVTKNAGHNRFVWSMQTASGLNAPPGQYQARLASGSFVTTVPLNVRIDPRLAAEGLTVADLQQQLSHNTKMRELVAEANALVTRLRAADARLRTASGAAADTLARVRALSEKLLTQPVRYGKPGLQAHISYLAGMTTRTDQKVGRDALERYVLLRKEFDAVQADANRLLGAERPQRME